MQTRSLLLGALAGLALTILSLSLVPSLASAKPVEPVLQSSADPTLITSDADNLYIVRYGIAYKVNKFQMNIIGRARLQ